MKVIFIKDVPNVARQGDVKQVSDGYGRNFLVPRKLAVFATDEELQKLKEHRTYEKQSEARTEAELKVLAEILNNTTITVTAKSGTDSKLYGSITTAHIAEDLGKVTGYKIDKRKIELVEPIKMLGNYQVKISVAKDIDATVKIVVEPQK
ncbi:MAG: 50S ribosomal protein L9 [Chloroflexi bacterium]|nr:50S ribosomal protein L9 [Chloroflexota bacterium]